MRVSLVYGLYGLGAVYCAAALVRFAQDYLVTLL